MGGFYIKVLISDKFYFRSDAKIIYLLKCQKLMMFQENFIQKKTCQSS